MSAEMAVIGCHSPTERTSVDEDELERTSADDPPAVLKTAGLASVSIHQRSLEFDD
jgi:hypothetical protein